jgi:hypothetical protein
MDFSDSFPASYIQLHPLSLFLEVYTDKKLKGLRILGSDTQI